MGLTGVREMGFNESMGTGQSPSSLVNNKLVQSKAEDKEELKKK